jgi:hypothetical protein
MAKKGEKLSQEAKDKISIATKGKKRSKEGIENMRRARLKNPTKYWLGKKRPELMDRLHDMIRGTKISEDHKKKISESLKGRSTLSWTPKGENHYRWISDRSKLSKQEERNDSSYKEWRKNVWLRDDFKCRISDENCKGRIEAHHILSYKDHPELRYQINNGITLCHAHHPRKRSEEVKLSPYFQSLVAEGK